MLHLKGLRRVQACRDLHGRSLVKDNRNRVRGESELMPNVTVVYWRDIPAQVIVGKGRRATKMPLSERFEQSIDRCAMKVGAKDADAYLSEWRRASIGEVEGEPAEVAASEVARLESAYDRQRIKSLIDNDGWSGLSHK